MNITVTSGFNFSNISVKGQYNLVRSIARDRGWQFNSAENGQGQTSREFAESMTATTHAIELQELFRDRGWQFSESLTANTRTIELQGLFGTQPKVEIIVETQK